MDLRLHRDYRDLLSLALPVIVAQLGQMSVQLVDNIMVGQLGSAVPLAAVSFANGLTMAIMMVGVGVSMGLTPLVSRAYARDDLSRIQSLLKNSAVVNTIIGALLASVLLGLTFFMDSMGQDASIIPTAKTYTYLMVLGMFPMMWMCTARQFLEGLGNTKWTMVITITGNIINVIFNFILIFGLWGAPKLGAVGAGIATVISRFAMVAMYIVLFSKRDAYRRFFVGIRHIALSRFRSARLLNIGFPIAIQLGIEMTTLALMGIAIGTFGADALAGHQVAINLPSAAFMVVTGVSNATTIIVARNYGLRLYDQIKRTLKVSITVITVFMVSTAILFVLFAEPIVSIFTPEISVREMAAYLLIFGACFQISDGIQGVTLGALRGLLDVKRPMIYAVCVYTLIGIPLGYIITLSPLTIGPAGAWVAFIVSISALSVLYLRRFNKIIKHLSA